MRYIYTIIGLIFTYTAFAQAPVKKQLQTFPVNSITKEYKIDNRPHVPVVMISAKENIKTVASITSYIEAVQEKIDYIQSDQTQREEAEKSGWFDEMYQFIEGAKKEKELLIQNNNK